VSFHLSSDVGYDNFMGRYSTRLAPLFADFAGIGEGHGVLDVGAGTGALTAELERRGAAVAAADPSAAFVATLRRRFPTLDVRQAPAEELPWADESFDGALAQLVVSFMRDAPAGMAEMRRVARSGGVVAVCMWDREGMEMLGAVERTQDALDPTRNHVSVYRTREEIERLLGAGAQTELITVESEYADFEELWGTLLDGAGPAGAWVASLDEPERAAAREELHRQVGEPDGRFTLTGRAWAVRVTRA
jgi:SAM-dependent methyltransferase